jgi:rhodanese-related sulfurtransferase
MPTTSSSCLWRDAASMLLAAVALGFAYNSASPLGIRTPSGLPASSSVSAYANETLSLDLESNLQGPRLKNDTISAEIAPGGAPAAREPGKSVTWTDVKPLLAGGSLLLVDARSAEAFNAGHIPGAVSLPFTELEARITRFTSSYPRTTAIVVYCADTECPVSTAEAGALRQQFGYINVREMPGGYVSWRLAEEGARK